MYPLFFVASAIAIYLGFVDRAHVHEDSGAHVATVLFLGLLAMNLVVLAFDFPRTTSLTLFFLIAAMVMGAILLFTFKPDLVPSIKSFIVRFRPFASASFYWAFAAILGLLLIASMIAVRFDYWEVQENELLHRHGFLADLERYPSPNLRVDKEITDIFEYLLLGSGRLILHMSGERRAIILDNVPRIETKVAKLTQMLQTLHVQLQTGDAPE